MTASPASDQRKSSDRITHSSRTRLRIISQDMCPKVIAWNPRRACSVRVG